MIKVDAPELVLDRLDLDERLAALREVLLLAPRLGLVVECDVAAESPARVEIAEPGLSFIDAMRFHGSNFHV